MDICFICKEEIDQDGRLLLEKARSTLLKSSEERKDGLVTENDIKQPLHVHNKCIKSYTRKKSIERYLTTSKSGSEENVTRTPRQPYNYKTHCLICEEELDFDSAKKHSKRQSAIIKVKLSKKGYVKVSLMTPRTIRQCLIEYLGGSAIFI